eukprot:4862751-Pyramimonas_sp.AAC.1
MQETLPVLFREREKFAAAGRTCVYTCGNGEGEGGVYRTSCLVRGVYERLNRTRICSAKSARPRMDRVQEGSVHALNTTGTLATDSKCDYRLIQWVGCTPAQCAWQVAASGCRVPIPAAGVY